MNTTAKAITDKHPDVAIRTVQLDLSSLASVRKAVAEFIGMQKSEGILIDVLMLNAGIMACPYSKTVDGFETQILGASKKPRVISVSSEGHGLGTVRFADVGFRVCLLPFPWKCCAALLGTNANSHNLQKRETYDKWRADGRAKTENALYALSLTEKLGPKGLLALRVDPGGVMIILGRHMDLQGEDMEGLCKPPGSFS
ncbi:hypothetical protein K469DRAFT_793277 [Zopfia rhizophila CBS 207.26]|uniref:NAD(P)-binding protein n=1 Tax=Zopfia rhizophila CBS 207.26 TaxID=1314779 RepID=A0A6A6DMV3_9PEZI|nr:hypothetical protein K469DRAFT_793277 [Zopfia rhizophila CBS 207.26]